MERKHNDERKHTFVKRWLQVLAVSCYSIHFILYFFNFIALAYIQFCTKYWMVLPMLFLWVWYDSETPNTGGRPSQILLSNPILKYFRSYFPMKLVKTADLDPDKNYLFCSHPHGYCCIAVYGNFLMEYSQFKQFFPKHSFRTATSDFSFNIPLIRELVLGVGLISASKKSITYLLKDDNKGNIVNLLVGGAAEVLYSEPGQYKIILKKRKGFVKTALTVGCSLVPVINFGEVDVFERVGSQPGTFMYTLQNLLKKMTGICWAVPYGSFWFFPKRVPVTSVVGKPIHLPKIANPSEAEIDHYHALYTKELIQLFNDHKFKYVEDPENTDLIIVE